MKKIFSFKTILFYFLVSIFLGAISIVFFVFMPKHFFLQVIGGISMALSVSFVVVGFIFTNHIEIGNEKIIVNFCPFLATNKYYQKKRALINWNGNIVINEIKKIELVKLSKEEKEKFIGCKTLFSQYLKIYLNNSESQKYIYISLYSRKQIDNLLSIVYS